VWIILKYVVASVCVEIEASFLIYLIFRRLGNHEAVAVALKCTGSVA
jgi:hypothetical protein